jgi:MoaA/NifB/PqqE/SkfB family radical SAM enzyme
MYMPKTLLDGAEMVFLEVTNHCNFRCSFCPQGISVRPPQHMDSGLAKRLIDQLYEAGYRNNLYFHLLGEPFLHLNIFEIVKYAAKRIPRTILFTNGSLLTDRNIESVFAASPYELMVSMQTVDEKHFRSRSKSMSWQQYITRIRNAVEYKLTNNSSTLLRISVGVRKEDTIHPEDNYFPHIPPARLKAKIYELFSGVPSLNSKHVKELFAALDIPFKGWLEIGSDVFLSIKLMGNWRRIYSSKKTKTGFCPYVGREFGILSNGDAVFCHLDYDARTRFTNVRDLELRQILEDPEINHVIAEFREQGIVADGCQFCTVPHRYPSPPTR